MYFIIIFNLLIFIIKMSKRNKTKSTKSSRKFSDQVKIKLQEIIKKLIKHPYSDDFINEIDTNGKFSLI
jgi:hypothetical protein